MTSPEHAVMNAHKSGSFLKGEVTLSRMRPPSMTNTLNSLRGQVTRCILDDCFVTFSYELVDGLGTE